MFSLYWLAKRFNCNKCNISRTFTFWRFSFSDAFYCLLYGIKTFPWPLWLLVWKIILFSSKAVSVVCYLQYFTGPITYNFMNQFRMFMFPLRPAYSDGHIVMSSRPSHGLSVLFGFNWTFNCHCCVGNWLKWIFTYRYSLRLCQNLNMPVVKHPDERDKGVTPISSENGFASWWLQC